MTDDTQSSKKSEVSLREEEILAFWNKEGIFERSLEQDAPEGEFVFYDGPPFATGVPHYGHILASTIKDTIPRYKTMRGFRVRRKWGWDCHGLPLENLVEKELGLATKRDIEELGVEKFNEAARATVMKYADVWKQVIPRMGRWADMEDDYKTMDATYTESVWWSFKALNEKGLVYEGYKSMHLCPRCGTTLSNFEVNQGYQDIKDISVTVELPLLDEKGNTTDTSLLVWTTTPWTLPGNMAAAVHKDYDYVTIEKKDEGTGKLVRFILAKERLEAVFEDDVYEIVSEMKGAELVGRSYEPPFAYFKDRDIEGKKHAWKIYHADYVELGNEGTGAVHLAPAYGDEDMELAKSEGIPIVHHVGRDGRFLDFVTDFAGMQVKPKDDTETGVKHVDADIEIVKALTARGRLFKKENITHSYPHCWRCDTPLLNYATTSWFVRATEIKDALIAENNGVHWVPKHVGQARFGDWLENVRDWAVSRQRYWGAPLPVWRNTDTGEYRVLGSLAELQQYVKRSGNRYFMMRHGESISNATGVVSAHADNKDDVLTEQGVTQVTDAISELPEGIDLIIHSGFARTEQTAKIVADTLGLGAEQVIVDARIGEVAIAREFEGKTWNEYNAQFPTWESRYTKRIDGIENRRDVQTRVGAFLYELEEQYVGKTILVIGHGGTLFGLACVASGADPKAAKVLHDAENYLPNAAVRALPFIPMPHNRHYELDYHRPYIDEIELYDESGTKLERVPDIFDCWYESGSMPYAQQHYPFENTATFDPETDMGYPAHFIAEGLDQTRGWFYSLIVLGTALFGRSPYKNVIVNGLILAEDGKKMSKRLQNYPDPMLIADKYGVDTMRFYMLSSPVVKGEDLNFSEKGLSELARKNIGRLHNVLSFYELYRDDAVAPRADSSHILDRWIYARLDELVTQVTDGFENYELDRTARPVTDFIDDLSVWYLRRSRDRFKEDAAEEMRDALGTLRYVLGKLAQVIAPSMPFYAEYLYQRVREKDVALSVHLTQWPEAGNVDDELLATMSLVRTFVTEGLMRRSEKDVKVRQPLARFSIKHDGPAPKYWEECVPLIRDELNVKEVVLEKKGTEGPSADFDWNITPELKAEGTARELMRSIQDMRKEKGLAPKDRIALTIAVPAGDTVLDIFRDDIIRTVGADTLTIADTEGVRVEINGNTYTVCIATI